MTVRPNGKETSCAVSMCRLNARKSSVYDKRNKNVSLPQTDRASAFVVDPVKIFLTSGLITV